MAEERLQKIIAASGTCSRRKAEELIREGRVTVNGHPAEVGQKADPERDHIKVNGRMVRPERERRYLLLFKPREVMTTCDDPEGRPTVLDLLGKDVTQRVFPVGRLDYHSEGLLLLTNDGDFAERVTHPRYGVVREYLAKVRGDLSPAEHQRLLRGTRIEGRLVRPLEARRERGTRDGANSWWRVTITEGRTHEVRELFFRAGHHVQRLRRVAIGPLRDTVLKPGQYRELAESEVEALRTAARRTIEKQLPKTPDRGKARPAADDRRRTARQPGKKAPLPGRDRPAGEPGRPTRTGVKQPPGRGRKSTRGSAPPPKRDR